MTGEIIMGIKLTHDLPLATICSASLLASVAFNAQATGAVPPDPDTFLTFLERHAPEDAVSAAAYYAAVDPDNKKTTYADWLVETGFIDNISDYSSTGPFTVNADTTTVVHQNIADLGFIRRVTARCVPSCDDPNPDIYSVIENYPTFDDAANRTRRLASVTMERISAADGSNPSDKFVVFYAYTGGDSRNQLNSAGESIPFQPDLDGRGEKAIPGLCNTCHGGTPKKLHKDGSYKDNGDTNALFLPMDLNNFAFDPDPTRGLSSADQQAAYKKMNQVALITHRGTEAYDEVAGNSRLAGGHELIEGWYGGPGMPNNTFNGDYVPPGWLPPAAPTGADVLYSHSVAPACRACHVQQERALDFATYEGFMVFEDAHKELVLSIECGLSDDPKVREKADNQAVMPLALETYKKFWEGEEATVFKDHLGAVDCDNL
jgi:hypothetical protein